MKNLPLANGTLMLLCVMVLGALGHNRLVVLAAGLLLLVDLAGLRAGLGWLRRYGPTTGFVLLVSALLTSFVKGQEPVTHILELLDWRALAVTLLAGVAASVLCKQGMDLLELTPELIVGLIVGSLIGVLLLKGVPVGPFVAAGMAGLVLRALHGSR